jgi:hypothetical protein
VCDVGVFPCLQQLSVLCCCGRYRAGVVVVPGGRRRSSTGSPCGGSSCERSGACPSWCPA